MGSESNFLMTEAAVGRANNPKVALTLILYKIGIPMKRLSSGPSAPASEKSRTESILVRKIESMGSEQVNCRRVCIS